MVTPVRIGARPVGPGHPCLVVAELGVNHDGELERGLALVDAAAAAGADAVKVQTFSADRVASAAAPKPAYQRERVPEAESQQELLRRLELSVDDHRALARRARERGVLFLSTPFDEDGADLLEELDVPAFKVASPDLTNTPLVLHLARKGRPLILSTGMAYLAEVEDAVAAVRAAGNDRIVVLQCVSAYPADPADANLRAMATLAEALGVPVGYSDHTTGTATAVAAAALGACLLEKHLTLDRTLPGPDHAASLEPDELARLVAAVREAESALGDGVKEPRPAEAELRLLARRSLAAARDLAAGEVLAPEMLTALRPGTGIPPGRLDEVTGRVLARPVRGGELLDPLDLR